MVTLLYFTIISYLNRIPPFLGIQQTPAVGRAISELIIDGDFRTIDLTRLGFDRIIVEQPMFEVNIV